MVQPFFDWNKLSYWLNYKIIKPQVNNDCLFFLLNFSLSVKYHIRTPAFMNFKRYYIGKVLFSVQIFYILYNYALFLFKINPLKKDI